MALRIIHQSNICELVPGRFVSNSITALITNFAIKILELELVQNI